MLPYGTRSVSGFKLPFDTPLSIIIFQLQDFEKLGQILLKICEEVQAELKEEHPIEKPVESDKSEVKGATE